MIAQRDGEPYPELPAAYRLEVLEEVDCLRDRVAAMAREGAGEGTIVQAYRQKNARAIGSSTWQALEGNLHVSLILEPEVAEARFHELLFVAVVSMGASIAGHVSPMTALQYGWPNDICIARNKIAALWLDHGYTEQGSWLTVTCSVNVAQSPEIQTSKVDGYMPEAMSLHEAEGNSVLSADTLLENWAREFVSWINIWDERGFSYIMDFWRQRADLSGQPVRIHMPAELISGTAAGVNDNGDLLVELEDGTQRSVSVRLVLGLENPPAELS